MSFPRRHPHLPSYAAAYGTPSRTGHVLAALATLVLLLAGLVAGGLTTGPAHAETTNPYQKGPAPTWTNLKATTGPFATAKVTVDPRSDFGGATIYYPTDTTTGTYGAVVISPGNTAKQNSIAWYGPRVASRGFIVMTIDTLTTTDDPSERADQLVAATSYLKNSAPAAVLKRLDPNRIAVSGHSMGGGGALLAARDYPNTYKAVIALTPWALTKDFSTVTTPTFILTADSDDWAPADRHGRVFYDSLPTTTPASYLMLAGAEHTAPNWPNGTIAAQFITWMKRFVDNDTRYDPFICPGPTGDKVATYLATCPL